VDPQLTGANWLTNEQSPAKLEKEQLQSYQHRDKHWQHLGTEGAVKHTI
jgi:hypothetical protein